MKFGRGILAALCSFLLAVCSASRFEESGVPITVKNDKNIVRILGVRTVPSHGSETVNTGDGWWSEVLSLSISSGGYETIYDCEFADGRTGCLTSTAIPRNVRDEYEKLVLKK